MRLSTRLLFALVPLMAALVLLGWLAVGAVNRLGEHSHAILSDNFRSVLASQGMLEALERMDSASLFLVAGPRVKAMRQYAKCRTHFETELVAAEANITEPGEPEALSVLRAGWKEYQAAFEAFAAAPAQTGGEYFARMEPLFLQLHGAARRVLTINQDAMAQRDAASQVAVGKTRQLLTAVAAGALLLGLLGSAWFTRRLWRPLESLILAAHRLGEGDLEMRATVVGGDEVSELALEFNRMAEKLGEYRRSATGQMVQAQRASQAAIDSIPYPVLVLTADRGLLTANEAGRGLLHLEKGGAGADALAQVGSEVRSAVEMARDHVLSGRGPYLPRGFEEAVRLSATPEDRWLLPRAKPVYGDHGGVVGVTVVLQDVTRLRRFDELKNDLVATVAHEFRTPLTSLHMAIHLCVEERAGPLTDKQLDLLHAARHDCERLQNITDDILDLARLQAGTAGKERHPEDPRNLVREAMEAHRGLSEEAGVALTSEVEEPLSTVAADREAIGRVLTNLVTNALRHTPRGGSVRIQVKPIACGARFEVVDTGPGIAMEHEQRIFDRFYRVPGGERTGAGLGLAIAREIVQRHAGDIGVSSRTGEGSAFWFTLPEAAAH